MDWPDGARNHIDEQAVGGGEREFGLVDGRWVVER